MIITGLLPIVSHTPEALMRQSPMVTICHNLFITQPLSNTCCPFITLVVHHPLVNSPLLSLPGSGTCGVENGGDDVPVPDTRVSAPVTIGLCLIRAPDVWDIMGNKPVINQ